MGSVPPELLATVLDAVDARSLAEFYRELLGYVYRAGDEPPSPGETDPQADEWLVLTHPAGTPRLAFQPVPDLARATWPDNAVPQQLHLDFGVPTPDALAQQSRRAVNLGATIIEDRRDDPDEALIVHADPAGHPFCILVTASAAAPSASGG